MNMSIEKVTVLHKIEAPSSIFDISTKRAPKAYSVAGVMHRAEKHGLEAARAYLTKQRALLKDMEDALTYLAEQQIHSDMQRLLDNVLTMYPREHQQVRPKLEGLLKLYEESMCRIEERVPTVKCYAPT